MDDSIRPTVRSLARELGISPTTVSEALRNHPRVNAKTRARVQEAAAAAVAGYQFNPLASSLLSEVRRKRISHFQGVLAAVDLVEPARPAISGSYLRDLLRGATERAEQLGFKMERFSIGRRGLTVQRLDTILQSRGIRGVLIMPAWQHPNFTQLSWANYAGVYADYLIERPALHSVCPDHHRAMMSIMAHLKSLGYRRPGLVLQKQQTERIQRRWDAAFLAHRDTSSSRASPLHLPDQIEREDFQTWFRTHEPDVVLGHSADLVDWMTACGARVPETHGFCCLNVGLNSAPTAGVDLQPYHVGVQSIEQVIAQIHHNVYGIPEVPCTTTVPCQWVDGPTLPASEAARRHFI
ncbi:MAG: LacI family DNA-binding transcriptional regulator [Opitutaceae bacterium]